MATAFRPVSGGTAMQMVKRAAKTSGTTPTRLPRSGPLVILARHACIVDVTGFSLPRRRAMSTRKGKTLSSPSAARDALAAAAIVLPFLWWGIAYLNRDLWWDEIISLLYFSLQAFKDTAGHLESTNNHIFFNLVSNVFTRAVGERDFYALIDRASLLRSLQFAFAAATVLLTSIVGRRFFSPRTGFLAALILVTTVPFLNFMMQLRGYSLSMMLVVATLYCIWSYETAGGRRHLVLALISVFCLVYTVLSNAYFVLALGAIYAFTWLRDASGRRRHTGILLTLLGAGLLLAVAYAPVWEDFRQVSARQLGVPPPYRTFVLRERLPGVLSAFVAFRYALPILFLAGAFLIVRRSLRGQPTPLGKGLSRFYQLLVLLLLPFLISFARNELPYDRTFVHLAPVFSLLLAAGIAALLDHVKLSQRRPLLVSAAIAVYCIATLVYAHHAVEQRLYQDLFTGKRDQDLLYNYYQSRHYAPGKDIRRYAAIVKATPRPVLGVDDIDRFATSFYFNKYDVAYYATVAIDDLGPTAQDKARFLGTYWRTNGRYTWPPLTHTKLEFELPVALENKEFYTLYSILKQKGVIGMKDPDFYVVTPYPERFAALVRESFPQLSIARLNEHIGYTNLFAVNERETR